MKRRNPNYWLRRLTSEDGVLACATCGKSENIELQVDHIVALADGGEDERANIQLLCRECHKKKTAIQHRDPRYDKAKRMRAIRSGEGRWYT